MHSLRERKKKTPAISKMIFSGNFATHQPEKKWLRSTRKKIKVKV
jgi:hypothetical protein